MLVCIELNLALSCALFIYPKASAGCRAHAAATVHLRLHGCSLLGSGDPSPWIGAVPLALHLDPAWPAVLWACQHRGAQHTQVQRRAGLLRACTLFSTRLVCHAFQRFVWLSCGDTQTGPRYHHKVSRGEPTANARCRPFTAQCAAAQGSQTGLGHAVSAWHWLLWASGSRHRYCWTPLVRPPPL